MTISLRSIDRHWRVIGLLVVICVVIELLLQGADRGFWGTARWRLLSYQNGAFWPGLLHGWRSNYSAQPYTMFLTYAFLHGGLVHLAVNMVTLVSLGMGVIRLAGQAGFALIYISSTVFGGVVFVALSSGHSPMVGASGALFGLAGALVAWNIRATLRQNPGFWTAAAAILWPFGILIALNLLMFFGSSGRVAWETHLGGFLAGFATALLLRTSDEG